MPRTAAADSGEQKLLDDVARFGWHCVQVLGEAKHQPFSYTIGLFHSFRHPELLIYGLPAKVAHSVLAIAAAAAERGSPIDLSRPSDELLEGYACHFVAVPPSQYAEQVGFALWYYEHQSFPVQQIVWPSKSGLFPWHPEATQAFREAQPVLGHPERAA